MQVCGEFLDTYDYLPDSQANYPFAVVGESFNSELKSNDLIGTIDQTIHIFGHLEDRPKLDKKIIAIHDSLTRLELSFFYYTKLDSFSTRTLVDNSTGEPLLHVVIETTLTYTRKDD